MENDKVKKTTEYIEIDKDWRIKVEPICKTLQCRKLIKPKNIEPYYDWRDSGFYGSVDQAMRGYIRSALDILPSIEAIIKKQDEIEGIIKEYSKQYRAERRAILNKMKEKRNAKQG